MPEKEEKISTDLAKKNGRPRHIETPEEFDRLVDNYIEMCRAIPPCDEYPHGREETPISLTGMIMALGLTSRTSLEDYKTYDGFLYSVKRAKIFVENAYEMRMIKQQGSVIGSIFALKNFNWTDGFKGIDPYSSEPQDESKQTTFKVIKSQPDEKDITKESNGG